MFVSIPSVSSATPTLPGLRNGSPPTDHNQALVVTQREERSGRDVACDRSPELPVVVSCSDAGCIPLFLMAAAASGEAKNRRNCFAIASCSEVTTTPPEYTVIF